LDMFSAHSLPSEQGRTERNLLASDLVVQRNAVPAELDVIHVFTPTALDRLVPQWNSWQILEQDLLGFVEDLRAFSWIGSRKALAQLVVEFFAGVLAVVGTCTGAEQRAQEVVQRWVVSLPTGTERTGHLVAGD